MHRVTPRRGRAAARAVERPALNVMKEGLLGGTLRVLTRERP